MSRSGYLAFAAVCIGLACSAAERVTARKPIVSPVSLDTIGVPERPSITAALHLHGWSNHGGSVRPASIEWHTQQYAAANVDLIWWTDHSDIYFRTLANFITIPSAPILIAHGLWTIGTWGPKGAGNAFLRWTGVDEPVVSMVGSTVVAEVPPGPTDRLDTLELRFGLLEGTRIGHAALNTMSRPLVGDPLLNMSVLRSPDGSLPEAEVLIPLSWHPDGVSGFRQVLDYRYGEFTDTAVVAVGDTLVNQQLLPPSGPLAITIAPLDLAARWPNGTDNVIDELIVRFVVSAPSGTTVSFMLPSMTNRRGTAAVEMTQAVNTARAAAARYGVRMIWGIEGAPITPAITSSPWDAVNGAGRHMAVYLPADVSPAFVDADSLAGPDNALTTRVRAAGGLTSIPHPFGTGASPVTATEQDQAGQVAALGAFLVPRGAWGADMIEVGYRSRGGVSLRAHLDLLDYLLASGLHICGVGTTDAHGGYFKPDGLSGGGEDNNFVTWIADVTRQSAGSALISAMRSCNVSFGDVFYVRGGLWADLEVDVDGTQSVSVDAGGVPPSATLYLYEAEVDSTGAGHEPQYRQRGVEINRAVPVAVGGCKPAFARVEAWLGGRPLAFSNVVRVVAVPGAC